MNVPRYASVLGLGFGDCGKGLFIDALTRRWKAHTIVRFSGGAQAGHNVVEASAGLNSPRHHTFSQFGAGSFVPGVSTVLLDPMIVHPTALLLEAEVLKQKGVPNVLGRLLIDSNCRITTPFHQAAGRIREMVRGRAAHGTCGVGVGETVKHALEHPEQAVRYGELEALKDGKSRQLLEKLQSLRETLVAELTVLGGHAVEGAVKQEWTLLKDEAVAGRWLDLVKPLVCQCPPATGETIASRLKLPGNVLFEGAQGILLDEWRGFHPHTTWSSITTHALEAAVSGLDLAEPMAHFGVMRTYLTRHGAGPFPTFDPTLGKVLPEPHNQGEGWQGDFRRGHPDVVLLRYALDTVGHLSGLLISHADVFERGVKLRWCEKYAVASSADSTVERLPVGALRDLDHQSELAELLRRAEPQYAREEVCSEKDFLNRLSRVSTVPVVLCSHGNTHQHVRIPEG